MRESQELPHCIQVSQLRELPRYHMMKGCLKNPTGCTFARLLYMSFFFIANTSSSAQNPGGFLNIDCGKSEAQYVDPQTNLTWEGDGSYIRTGSEGVVSLTNFDDVAFGNHEALKTFRYFSSGQNKYCYDLPLAKSATTFLLRAMFLHGNSLILGEHTKFQVYVNASSWIMLEFYNEVNFIDYNAAVSYQEGIFQNPGAQLIHVCLVPEVGTPFISSLELRELDYEGTMYSDLFEDKWSHEKLFLTNVVRMTYSKTLLPAWLRYPYDSSDRLWLEKNDSHDIALNSSISHERLKALNNLPRQTTRYGVSFDDLVTGIHDMAISSFNYSLYGYTQPDGVQSIIFYIYCNESAQKLPAHVIFETLTNGEITWNISDEISMESVEFGDFNQANGHLLGSPVPSLYFFAIEVYRQNIFINAATDRLALEFVNFVKTIFNMYDWTGDPCFPVPHDWITCDLWEPVSANGSLIFVQQLSSLKLSNLSSTSKFLEFIPGRTSAGTLAGLSLKDLSITCSDINTNVMQYFLNNITASLWLQTLNLSHNDITTFWNKTLWSNGIRTSPEFTSLFSLDLSHNQLDDKANFDDPNITFFGVYTSSLFGLIEVNVSHNHMCGMAAFDLFSNNSDFKFLDADHNAITGINLTAWHKNLGLISNKSDQDPVFHQLFSFAYNNISHVIPTMADLESGLNTTLLIDFFNEQLGGVILGGNPCCKDPKTLFQRYLCRLSLTDKSYELQATSKSKEPLYMGIGISFGAALLLILGWFAIFYIWRLREQVQVLQDFQEELLNRKVQPPFFSYQNLKIATRDFHDDNKLGSGAFGAVYKGVLQDGTTIAVKRLFTRQLQDQMLNDFLNEVVLLTGIKHKNLVQLLGCSLNNKERILVFEYVEGGNIAETLWGEHPVPISVDWDTRVNMCLGVARGLAYLHEELQPRIIHRDIKALNILIDGDLNPKVADFGLAKPFKDGESHAEFTRLAGTIGYCAPEYVLNGLLTEKADVYSFGVLLLEIVSGRKCFDLSLSEDQILLKDWVEKLWGEGNLLQLLQPELDGKCDPTQVIQTIKIARLCLTTEHKQRPSMSQVIIMLGDVSKNQNLDCIELRERSCNNVF